MAKFGARPYGGKKGTRKDTLEDLTGMTRGTLTAIRHTDYCTATGSAFWLFQCSTCGGQPEITRKRFLHSKEPYPCPICNPTHQRRRELRMSPMQRKSVEKLTSEERELLALIMRGREPTKANIEEALQEVKRGRENVLAYYAPQEFHLQPIAAGSSLSSKQFGYKQKKGF